MGDIENPAESVLVGRDGQFGGLLLNREARRRAVSGTKGRTGSGSAVSWFRGLPV
jgi:hypothetical protein